ncbi:uncharacterized protein LOC129763466 [Toxorhynchites rutilus septentrionalis]|uniref:uncharacterized protein LOC129763466 n=1 Tax=Toxorhynchites rutilus septentrionalis TaxID=329112 RepID=UPI0024783C54|nr:uncharacterized protein LOC129763466 [Toxorhynchites rutilus septentrionalis]
MGGNVVHWFLAVMCIFRVAAANDLSEFRDPETLVSCFHDSAPRFGKRICDCGYRNQAYFIPKFEGSTTEIEIANCKSLRIPRGAFSNLFQLTKLTIVNVESLALESNSMDFTRNDPSARLRITFINNLIEEVPSHVMSGPIAEVSFTRCRIGSFQPYSITNIYEQMENFNIVECFVNRLERHAFKRFDISQITIEGSEFVSPIPSQSFYEVDVLNRFVIVNSTFHVLLPSAFTMKNVTSLVISNSEFKNIGGESLHMQIRNNIRITGNYFNIVNDLTFQGITLDSSYYTRHSEKPALLFHNNRMGRLEGTKSLYFSGEFTVQLRAVFIEHSISCDEVIALKQSSIFSSYADEIYFDLSDRQRDFRSLSDIRNVQCAESRFWLYLIVGLTVTFIIITLIVLLISLYCVRKRRKLRKLDVVMPEPRTYRETQIIMQIENHGLLKTDL